MSQKNLVAKISFLENQRNVIAAIAAILLLISLFLSWKVLVKDEMVIILPSTITGKYYFQGDQVSSAYLIDRAIETITHVLGITPSNSDYHLQKLLKLIHPLVYPSVKKEFIEMSDDVKKRNITTFFFPSSAEADEKKKTVLVEGELHTLIGNKVEVEQQKYLLGFASTGTGVLLVEFKQLLEGKDHER